MLTADVPEIPRGRTPGRFCNRCGSCGPGQDVRSQRNKVCSKRRRGQRMASCPSPIALKWVLDRRFSKGTVREQSQHISNYYMNLTLHVIVREPSANGFESCSLCRKPCTCRASGEHSPLWRTETRVRDHEDFSASQCLGAQGDVPCLIPNILTLLNNSSFIIFLRACPVYKVLSP